MKIKGRRGGDGRKAGQSEGKKIRECTLGNEMRGRKKTNNVNREKRHKKGK